MREELVKYRIKDAKEKVASAEILLEAKQYKDSVSRSYYAMFSAARALLATKGYDSAKHSGVISLFNRHFVKNGAVSSDLGRLLAEVKDMRERGDYADFIEIAEEEAQEYLSIAKRFVKEISAFPSRGGQARQRRASPPEAGKQGLTPKA